jgi:hypothetical protein
MDGLAYLPGEVSVDSGLLARYLPPVPDGIASAFLAVHSGPGAWVLDPFGAAPRLDVEIARAGYRVLVAVNNPITRFLLELAANPPAAGDLPAALAELAASRKGDERLETHLQSLYLTECRRCQRQVQVEAFIWERGGREPVGRIYKCSCGESGEFPTSEADKARAAQLAARDGLHRSRALERVATPDDPDRPHAEEALECYLPRAVYTLITLVNKLESLSLTPPRRRALLALLLAVFDEANTLWPYPSERPRPRQLTVPPRYLEKNIWSAIEKAATSWQFEPPVPLLSWSELTGRPGKADLFQESGGLCVYEGPARDLAAHLSRIPPGCVVTVLPRPNQAFWTLSALWSGWLWGREAAAPFKSVVRRRRYDWNWHAEAIHAALKNLSEHIPLNAALFALLPEVEPAFLSAALVAAAGAGFDLSGIALRTRHDPLQIVWHRRVFVHEKKKSDEVEIDPEAVKQAMLAVLTERGEPTTYLHLHAAGLAAMAADHSLEAREDAMPRVHALLQAALAGGEFHHLSDSPNPEIGLWGLTHWSGTAEPLPDRVEIATVRFLQANPAASLDQLENTLNNEFAGLQTPSHGLLQAILNSYALQNDHRWSLRLEDSPSTRRQDLESCETALASLADRLEFSAERLSSPHRLQLWRNGKEVAFAVYLIASAVIGKILRQNPYPPEHCLLLLPGGRAGLLAYKLERDPGLKALAEGWRIVKFRQLRRLAEASSLTRASWEKELDSDPIEPPEQMKLF